MKNFCLTLLIFATASLVACGKDKKGGTGVPPEPGHVICNQLRFDTNYLGHHNYNNYNNRYIDDAGNQYIRQNSDQYRNLATDKVYTCPNIHPDNRASNNCIRAIQGGGYPLAGGRVQWDGHVYNLSLIHI